MIDILGFVLAGSAAAAGIITPYVLFVFYSFHAFS